MIQPSELSSDDEWSSIVFCSVFKELTFEDGYLKKQGQLLGYVLVIEPHRPDPLYKLAGGRKESNETPLQTGIRELLEETGLDADARACEEIVSARRWLGSFWSCLIRARVTEEEYQCHLSNKHRKNQGEEPKFFNLEKFYLLERSGGMMRSHFDRLVEAALILPEFQEALSAD
ncbi:MAG: hypothetical protein JWL88_269 [Parcubacteria group bacterium]|nr:hypothetical protein [Parcubacteria group bacterium]